LTFSPLAFRPPVSFIMLLQQLELQVKIHSHVLLGCVGAETNLTTTKHCVLARFAALAF
jgi:hypothetical protein